MRRAGWLALVAVACSGGAAGPTARGTVVLAGGNPRIAASMIESVGFWEALIENGDVDGRALGDHPADALLHAVRAEVKDHDVEVTVTLADPKLALRICDGVLWAYQRTADDAYHSQGSCELTR